MLWSENSKKKKNQKIQKYAYYNFLEVTLSLQQSATSKYSVSGEKEKLQTFTFEEVDAGNVTFLLEK